jgi:hypothetical protein
MSSEITLITDFDPDIGLYYFIVNEGQATLHFCLGSVPRKKQSPPAISGYATI